MTIDTEGSALQRVRDQIAAGTVTRNRAPDAPHSVAGDSDCNSSRRNASLSLSHRVRVTLNER